MKRRDILSGVGLLLATYCLAACWPEGRSEAEEKTSPWPAPSNEAAPAWAGELSEIRRKLGGGALQGSLLDGPPQPAEKGDAEFLKELRRLSEQQPSAPGDSFAPLQRSPAPEGDAALIESLRHAARLLDEKANRLEIENHYPQADRHRKLARRLRLEAREFAIAAE